MATSRCIRRLVFTVISWSMCFASAKTASALGELAPATRQTYERLYSEGKHHELVALIEPKASGWFPQEFFFAGASYFSLAMRTSVVTQRCIFTERANDLLETFLVETDQGYRKSGHFGTTEDLNYLRVGVKMLDAIKRVSGCELRGYTEERLTRFAVRWDRQRVREVFFGLNGDPSSIRIREILDNEIYGRMQNLVDKAARIETRYGLLSVEIDSARTKVASLVGALNGLGQSTNGPTLVAYDVAKEQLVINAGQVDQTVASVRTGRHAAAETIQRIRSRVLSLAEIDDPSVYPTKKARTIEAFESLSSKVLTQTVVWTGLGNEQQPGRKLFADSLLTPTSGSLESIAANVDNTYRDAFGSECDAGGPFWFCTKVSQGGSP